MPVCLSLPSNERLKPNETGGVEELRSNRRDSTDAGTAVWINSDREKMRDLYEK